MRKLAFFVVWGVAWLPSAALAQPNANVPPSSGATNAKVVEAAGASKPLAAEPDVTVNFEPDSAALTDEATSKLNAVLRWLGEDEQRQVIIYQAAFARSQAGQSEGVAQQRVKAVRTHLRSGGEVHGGRIAVASGNGLAGTAAERSAAKRVVFIGTRGANGKLPMQTANAASPSSEPLQGAAYAPLAPPAPSWLGGESLLGAPTAPPPVSTALPLAQTPGVVVPKNTPARGASPSDASVPLPPTSTAQAVAQRLAAAAPVAPNAARAEAQPAGASNSEAVVDMQPQPSGQGQVKSPPQTQQVRPSAKPRAQRNLVVTQPGPALRRLGAGSRYDFGASTSDPSSQSVVWRQASSPVLTTRGLGLTVGGGVVGFLNSDTADVANTGGSWEARLIYGTRSLLAMEAAYIGSAQSLNVNGLPEGALLVGNGVEGNLRVNFTRALVQPYVFGGAGWSNYGFVRTQTKPSAVTGRDNVFHLPVGVGVSLRNSGMIFDMRATARFASSETLMRNAFADRSAGGAMDSWNVGAKLGWEL